MYFLWIKTLSSYETKKYVIVYSNLKTVAYVGLVTGNPPSHRLECEHLTKPVIPESWKSSPVLSSSKRALYTFWKAALLLELFKFNMTVCKTWKSFWHSCQKFGCCSWVMTFSFVYAFTWPKLKWPCSSAYTDSAQCGFYNTFVSANEVQRRMWCTRCTGFLSSSDGDAQHVPCS